MKIERDRLLCEREDIWQNGTVRSRVEKMWAEVEARLSSHRRADRR